MTEQPLQKSRFMGRTTENIRGRSCSDGGFPHPGPRSRSARGKVIQTALEDPTPAPYAPSANSEPNVFCHSPHHDCQNAGSEDIYSRVGSTDRLTPNSFSPSIGRSGGSRRSLVAKETGGITVHDGSPAGKIAINHRRRPAASPLRRVGIIVAGRGAKVIAWRRAGRKARRIGNCRFGIRQGRFTHCDKSPDIGPVSKPSCNSRRPMPSLALDSLDMWPRFYGG